MKLNYKVILMITLIIAMLSSVTLLDAKARKKQSLKGRSQTAFRSAGIYKQQESYQRALDLYTEVITLTPNHVESRVNVAELYFQLAEYELDMEAVELYLKSAEQFRLTIEVIQSIKDWRTYANFEFFLEESEKKIQGVYARIFMLGREMIDIDEIEMAKEAFEALIKLDPNRTEAYLVLVSLAQRENDSEAKMTMYHRLLEVAAGDANILRNIAIEHVNNRDWEEAKEYYILYIDAAPESVNGYLGLAFVNAQLEKYDEAVAVYERAIDLDPENVDILRNMADLYYTLNNLEKSISILKRLVALGDKVEEPEDHIYNITELCQLLAREQKWEEALSYAQIWHTLESDSRELVQYIIFLARQARDTNTQREFEAKLRNM
jgi:tetratricopeptide (TPR) repeat protein